MKKNFKKLTAIALTAAMTMGSAMTVFAETSSGATGEGDYEGPKPGNPPISVTLPTVSNVNYIADPNDLIQSTWSEDSGALNQQHADKVFSGDAGIYFLYDPSGDAGKKVYKNESQKLWAVNKSRQDVTVSVKLEVSASGDDSIGFADSATFASGDASRQVYLAVKDNKSGDAAITETAAAAFTTDLKGNEDNYKMVCDASGDYSYQMKDDKSGDAISGDAPINNWDGAAYQLEGAANKNADWGNDKLVFPQIKITWSCTEKLTNAAPSVADVTYNKSTGGNLEVPYSLGAGSLGVTAVTDVAMEFDGKVYSINGGWGFSKDGANFFSIEQDKVVIDAEWMSYYNAGEYTLYLQYDNDNSLNDGTYAAVKVTVE